MIYTEAVYQNNPVFPFKILVRNQNKLSVENERNFASNSLEIWYTVLMESAEFNPILRLMYLFCRVDDKLKGVEMASVTAGLNRLKTSVADVPGRVYEFSLTVNKMPPGEIINEFADALYTVNKAYTPEQHRNIFSILCDIAASDRNIHISELKELDLIADLWNISVREREDMIERSRRRFHTK